MKVTLRKGRVRGERCWVVDWTNGLGKRQRRLFDTKAAAEAEAETLDLQRKQTGADTITGNRSEGRMPSGSGG
jgi:hypothetical protein